MANKRFFTTILVATLLSVAFASYKTKSKKEVPITLRSNESYKDEWKRVDSLANKGLNKSALELTNLLYQKALQENAQAQLVKAVIHRMKFEAFMEEEEYIKAIGDLSNDCKKIKAPASNIIHSITAEIYWRYYENNRWRFEQRTTIANDFKQNDIRTWDLRKIVENCVAHYNLSVANESVLKYTPIDNFYDVLTHYNQSKSVRPTLYDFLAHRYADFFMNEEASITQPANTFVLDYKEYLEEPREFISIKILTQDSLSFTYNAIKQLQNLEYFHLQNIDKMDNSIPNESALVDIALKRLRWVKNKIVIEQKDSIYLNTLLTMEKRYTSSDAVAEIMYERASYYYSKPQTPENKQNKKTAHAICTQAIAKHPKSYGAELCKQLLTTIENKSISVVVEEVSLPSKPSKVLLTYTNINKAYTRVVKINKEAYNKANSDYQTEFALIKYLLQQPIVKSTEATLPDDKDFNSNSVELKTDELLLGNYALLVSNNAKFEYINNAIASTLFTVSNLSYVSRALTDGTTEVMVLHRETGEPLTNVSVETYYWNYNYSLRKNERIKGNTYTTNTEGVAIIKENQQHNFQLVLKKDNDILEPEQSVYTNYPNSAPDSYLTSHIYTDRSIYRPGQTIYFKGLVTRSTGKKITIVKNEKIVVTLYDVNYQKISDLQVTTNDFGTYNGTFTTPTGGLNGQMHITDAHGSVYVSVEEYKRPKFEVNNQPLKGSFQLNEEVKVYGKAKAYSGANTDGASVKYRVVRTANFPYWWYCWRGYYPSSPQMEITNGTTTTNDTGGYVINFKALPDLSVDKKSMPTFNYTVYVDVTDINGEVHSTQSSVKMGYTNLAISLATPNEIDIATENEQKWQVNTTNLNSVFEPATVSVNVYQLKAPSIGYRKRHWAKPSKNIYTQQQWQAWFPLDEYEEENNMLKWEKEKKVFSKEITTQKENTLIEGITKNTFGTGKYIIEAIAKDKNGLEVKDVKYITVINSASAVASLNELTYMRLNKESFEPGERASLVVGSKRNVKLLIEIEEPDSENPNESKIIERVWTKLNDSQETITIPIKEKNRGNIAVHVVGVNNNEVVSQTQIINVPYTNKQLGVSFETFRNKLLPGEKEEWRIKIKDYKDNAKMAEMLATLYDASLDAIKEHNWMLDLYNSSYARLGWGSSYSFATNTSTLFAKNWNTYYSVKQYKAYDALNWFGYYFYNQNNYYYRGGENFSDGDANEMVPTKGRAEGKAAPRMAMASTPVADVAEADNNRDGRFKNDEGKPGYLEGAEASIVAKNGGEQVNASGTTPSEQPATRKNFNETAFFYPHLKTNEQGELVIAFTIPEALTKWKMLGFAHTQDLEYSIVSKELVTQKTLMITTNPPRFFREEDQMAFAAKITNLSDKALKTKVRLELYDAITQKLLSINTTAAEQLVDVAATKSTPVFWNISIPVGVNAISYKITAQAENFSDGEENIIPVVTNSMLVTESLPLWTNGNETKNFTFTKLAQSATSSNTLRSHKLTLEYTSNPAWYAIQALPYLMEYPYECIDYHFSRLYANSLATHIANSNPKVKRVFDSWNQFTPSSLLSNLEKNQELKSALLEETPWALDAKDESERKKRVALLFDLNKMANEQEQSITKIEMLQTPNGGFTWFVGMPDSRHITQNIVTGLGHLDALKVKAIREDARLHNMMQKAVLYLDDRLHEDYENLIRYKVKLSDNHLSYDQIQYLYARSFFKDIAIQSQNKKAFDYYLEQSQKYWLSNNRYAQGMIALANYRWNNSKANLTVTDIVKSLKENAIVKEEMGMYWKEQNQGYYWYQQPIEQQALIIELFATIADKSEADMTIVNNLRKWLLKNKQTNDWKTTTATADACYALLLKGEDWLEVENKVGIKLGGVEVTRENKPDIKEEAGLGYIKTSWNGTEIKPDMGNITVKNAGKSVSWGSVYWQYFEKLDKITTAATPLQITKVLFKETNTATGPVLNVIKAGEQLNVGDKVKVRIEIRVDREMQYVHLKDMRASAFEPTATMSGYKYQDGLGYYQSMRDASANFFFEYLPKGTYVFEYALNTTQKGNFSNGITTMQCMYAPEFSSHSEGVRVLVK